VGQLWVVNWINTMYQRHLYIGMKRKLICDDQQHHLSLNEQPPLTSPIGLAVVPVKMSVSTFMTIAILYVFFDIQLYQYCVVLMVFI
jgi:hypothetical protein